MFNLYIFFPTFYFVFILFHFFALVSGQFLEYVYLEQNTFNINAIM